jgi:hypothetical protein
VQKAAWNHAKILSKPNDAETQQDETNEIAKDRHLFSPF